MAEHPRNPSETWEGALERLERAIAGKPHYGRNLVALAEAASSKELRLKAFELARRALSVAGADEPETAIRARRVLAALLPFYHVPMMNDARRNLAWEQALGRAVQAGAMVLEIGTGGGMLALFAARAGAGTVVTCERDPVLAEIARDLAARNGFGEVISVVGKDALKLDPAIDLPRPAELLFCDIFSDNFFGFEPLQLLADVRRRLVAPGAPVIPAAGAVRLALAEFSDYARLAHLDRAAGFDVSAFSCFTPTELAVPIGHPGLSLKSAPAEPFRFDFTATSHREEGETHCALDAVEAGTANGIAQWIRLELDAETVLEARPEPGAVSFSAVLFHPFAAPRSVQAGETIHVMAAYRGKRLSIWPVD